MTKQVKRLSYRAIKLKQNTRRFYFCTIPVDDLYPCCFVSKRDEDPKAGFQRSLNEPRANDIARYLAAGSGSIPSNIILSAQPVANLKYDSRPGSVSFVRAERAFLVLDGQHRLWGYNKCRVRHRVPVAIYAGLTRAEEAKLFIDINTNQRGVPAALLLDIKQIAEVESAKEKILRKLFDRLNEDKKSPLNGKLSASKSVRGRISRVTFGRALSGALASGVLMEAESDEARYRTILNYLNAFDAELSDKSLLIRSVYFEAIFDVLDEVVRNSLAQHRDAKQDSLQEIIRPLTKLDSASSGSALPTKKAIVSEMQAALRQNVILSEDML